MNFKIRISVAFIFTAFPSALEQRLSRVYQHVFRQIIIHRARVVAAFPCTLKRLFSYVSPHVHLEITTH